MSNYPSPHSSEIPTTRRVSPRHRITATPGTESTVTGQSTPSSILDNARDLSRSTQMRQNSMYSNSYSNRMRFINTVATVLDMGDANEDNERDDGSIPECHEAHVPNVATDIVVNTTAPTDDEVRTYYCDTYLDIPSHPCAGSCGRYFHICCV